MEEEQWIWGRWEVWETGRRGGRGGYSQDALCERRIMKKKLQTVIQVIYILKASIPSLENGF